MESKSLRVRYSVIIIILGITVGAYTIGMLVRAFIEGELLKIFGRRKVQKQIAELKDHFIVCGFGRIGRIICNELAADNIDFVVIGKKEDLKRMSAVM